MIYLDHAATSYPKPEIVYRAVEGALRAPLGNAGRGGHAAALASAEALWEAREALCSLFHAPSQLCVVLTKSATEALNVAIFSALEEVGTCDVLCSTLEHNSVLRPLYFAERAGRINLHTFEPALKPEETVCRFLAALTESTRLVVLTCRANTTGERLPVQRLTALAKRHGARVILDGAQSAGHDRLDLSWLGADALCVPAHKGLMGLMGMGALIVAEDFVPAPLLHGGSGEALRQEMPAELPERLEAGTANVLGAVALAAGARYVAERMDALSARCDLLAARVRTVAAELGYTLYRPSAGPIALLNAGSMHSEELAARLGARGIAVRGGLHCAPLAHRMLGTERQGAVRISFGPTSRAQDADALLEALSEIKKEWARS